MPSNSRLFVKPFIGGINTELSSVEDAILNTSDELNCTILPEGIRGRRLGFNIERDGVWTSRDPVTSYSGFYWKNVGNVGKDMIVQQINTMLYFYLANSKPFSVTDTLGIYFPSDTDTIDKGYVGKCDIAEYVLTTVNGEIRPLKYSIGSGHLFAVGPDIKPLKIEYKTGQFVVTPYSLNIRDLSGIDDGLAVDEMPPASPETVQDFGDLDIKHLYNLLNQGWREDDIIKFATDKVKWPSNNLQWFVGKDDAGEYNTEKLLQKYFGNTPAPRGHFILDYSTMSRADASGLYGVDPTIWDIDVSGNTYVRNRKLRARNPIENITKYFQLSEERVLKRLILKWSRLRRRSAKKSYDDRWSGKITYQIFGYNSGIGEYQIITSDSEVAYGASPEEVYTITIPMLENTEKYQQYKVSIDFDDDSNGYSIKYPIHASASIYTYYEGDKDIDSFIDDNHRASSTVTDITYMPGRLFYLVNDTVLFSQVITELGNEHNKCYQSADPTSEEISDIIVTDGGYVKFNDMGQGKAIKSFNRGVLVFGENVVYGLISPLEKTFTASEYDIVELSRAGIISGRSAVSTDNMVYYWSPLGIFRIGINPQTGSSLIAESVSNTTIQEWYDRIPNDSKETCRGCFDYVNNRIYWYYSQFDEDDEDDEDDGVDSSYKLNRCLIYDLTYNAFMPFKIEGDKYITDVFSSPTSYEISPTLYLRVNGVRVIAGEQPVIAIEEDDKVRRWASIQHLITDENGNVSFGDYNNREFKDFDEYSYDSYMVSRPIMFTGFSSFGNAIQDTSADKQVPILQTLFKRTEQGKLLPYKDPEKIINNGTITVSQFRTYNDVSITDLSYPIKSVKSVIDVTDISKTIQYIQVTILGNNGDNNNVKIAEGYVPYPTDKIITLPLKILTTEEFSHYSISVEVFHGESDVTGAENFTVTHFVTLNTGKEPFSSKYIAESGANIRMRWGWSLNDRSNRWDMVQNGYRPQKDFLHDEYVESRIHVRGRGKAFQVEIRNDDNKDFRLAGMNLVVRSK